MSCEIKDYLEQLKQVCDSCKHNLRCKDKTKLCIVKKLVWRIAKKTYDQRVSKGELNQ